MAVTLTHGAGAPATPGRTKPKARGRFGVPYLLLLPGLAWLDLAVEEDDAGRTVFRQKAWFHPRGLLGQLYWWSVTPFHGIVFGGMQRNIARAAEEFERTGSPPRRPSSTAWQRLAGTVAGTLGR